MNIVFLPGQRNIDLKLCRMLTSSGEQSNKNKFTAGDDEQLQVCMRQYLSDRAVELLSRDIVELMNRLGTQICSYPPCTPQTKQL